MKRLWIIATLSAFLLSTAYSQEVQRLAYVDVEEVFNAHPDTADIRARLKGERTKYQTAIDKRKKEIADMELDLQRLYPTLTDNEKKLKQEAIDSQKSLLTEFIEDSSRKLISLRNELSKPIYLKISEVIQKIGTEQGYGFIFRKGTEAVLYFDKRYDITKDVTVRLLRELELENR